MFGKTDKEAHGDNYDTQLRATEKGAKVANLPSRLRGTKVDKNVRKIPLDQVKARKQIREAFGHEALQELCNSLKEHGQLQPCTVFWSEDEGKYILVAGERRFRAAQLAELETLRADILDHEPDEAEHHEIQLIENVQREDLTPMEEAKAYQKFIDDFQWSQRQIAKKTGKNPSTINRALALLKLPAEILDELAKDGAPRRLAEALIKLSTLEEQKALLGRYRAGELTVHQAQRETSKSNGAPRKPVANKQIRVKKVDGIDLKATGKKKHNNTDYALATIAWCEDLATNKRAVVDVDAVRSRLQEVLSKLNPAA